MIWTTGQDEIIRALAGQPVEVICNAIADGFGIRRGVFATARHMQRIGVSTLIFEICPMCGARVRRLHRSGECAACSAKRNAEAIAKSRQIIERDEREVSNEERRYKTEYNRIAKQKERDGQKARDAL